MAARPILLLTAAVAVVGANSLILSPISGAVAADLPGTDAPGVMLAAAAYGLCTAASALLLAPQADRIGAGRALFWAVLGLALALAGSAVAPSLVWLAAAQGAAGVASGLALPAAYSLAAQIAPPGQEGRTIGRVLTGWTISLVFGVSLSAMLTDLIGWRSVFALLAALGIGTALTLGRVAPVTAPTQARAARSPLAAFGVPGIGRGLMVAGGFFLGFYGFYSFLGAHVTGTLGLPTMAAGAVTLCYGVGFGVGGFAARLIDRIGQRRMALPVYGGITCVYLVMIWAVGYYPVLLAWAFVWGIVQHFGLNLIVARLTALDPGQRGAIMGLNTMVTYLAVFGGATGFRPVFDGWGLSGVALCAAAAVSLSAIDAMVPRQDEPRAPDRA